MHTQALYTDRLSDGFSVLDLGSSCATILPDDVTFQAVCGLGMNMDELRENDKLTYRVVHDLNESPTLPFKDSMFDAVLL